jgi:hypothetical protein
MLQRAEPKIDLYSLARRRLSSYYQHLRRLIQCRHPSPMMCQFQCQPSRTCSYIQRVLKHQQAQHPLNIRLFHSNQRILFLIVPPRPQRIAFLLLRQADLGIDTKVGNTLLDLAFSVTCLVLDDLAVEHPTGYVVRQCYDLVEERRTTNGLYTVITSNKSIDEVEERWRPQGIAPGAFHEGTRVVERLRESWGELEVQGPNLRAVNYQDEEEE